MGEVLQRVTEQAVAKAIRSGPGGVTRDTAAWLANLGLGHFDSYRLGGNRLHLDSARMLLSNAIAARPAVPDYYYTVACTYMVAKDYPRADSFCVLALGVDSMFLPALACLTELRYYFAKREDALPLLRRITRLHPRVPTYNEMLGRMFLGLGRLDSAIAHFEAETATDRDFRPMGAPPGFDAKALSALKRSHLQLMRLSVTRLHDLPSAQKHRDALLALEPDSLQRLDITRQWAALAGKR
jgi:tetratricopeptide (TPR) repeat protein